MSLNRTVMADDIITLLKASVKTSLAKVEDKAIGFGTRRIEQLFALSYTRGILVTLGGGSVVPLTMGASKLDVTHSIEIVVYVIGHDPAADLKAAAALVEEIEEVLWANKTLANGGTIIDQPSVMFGPPVAHSDLTMHWGVIQVRYQKTGIA